ncbi:MAG: hypothetical protein KDI16_10490 [Halioglobus sp.]|nr:hypothetical protein [Halioglobus sp.]
MDGIILSIPVLSSGRLISAEVVREYGERPDPDIMMRNIWYLLSMLTGAVFVVLFVVWLFRCLVIG